MQRQCKDKSEGAVCGKPGTQVYPGVYMCPLHERALLTALADREKHRAAVRRGEAAAEKRRLVAALKERRRVNAEIHHEALLAAGESRSGTWMALTSRMTGVWEAGSAGAPTLGSRR